MAKANAVEAMEAELEEIRQERKFPAPAPDLKSEENSKNSEEERYTFRLDEEAHDAWTLHKFGYASPDAIAATIRRLHKKGMPVDTEVNHDDGSVTHFVAVDITLLERIVLMIREHRREHMRGWFRLGINKKTGLSQWECDFDSSFGKTRYVVDKNCKFEPVSQCSEWSFRPLFSIVENENFRIVIVELLEENVSQRARRRRERKGKS